MSGTAGPAEAVQFYRYTCAESSIGKILVVMTDDGVVDVFRGGSRKELLRTALAHHPGAGLIPDRGVHLQWVAAVVKRIELPWLESEVPIEDVWRSGDASLAEPCRGLRLGCATTQGG